MLKGKRLLDYSNLLFPNKNEQNKKNSIEIFLITRN